MGELGSTEQCRRYGRNRADRGIVDDDIKVRKGADVEVPPLSALESTCGSGIQNSDKLDDVSVDAEFCAGANAQDLGFSAALDTETEVSLEGGPAGLDGDWEGLAAESVASPGVSTARMPTSGVAETYKKWSVISPPKPLASR